jgi:hypothetical protein
MADYGRAGGVQLQVAAGVAANIARAGGVQLHVAAAASTNEARLAGIQMEVLALGTLGAIVATSALTETVAFTESLEASLPGGTIYLVQGILPQLGPAEALLSLQGLSGPMPKLP